MSTIIRPRKRGPLAVEGDFELFDADGNRLEVFERKRVLLCRCGASKSAPICDGSHNRIGFKPPNES